MNTSSCPSSNDCPTKFVDESTGSGRISRISSTLKTKTTPLEDEMTFVFYISDVENNIFDIEDDEDITMYDDDEDGNNEHQIFRCVSFPSISSDNLVFDDLTDDWSDCSSITMHTLSRYSTTGATSFNIHTIVETEFPQQVPVNGMKKLGGTNGLNKYSAPRLPQRRGSLHSSSINTSSSPSPSLLSALSIQEQEDPTPIIVSASAA